MHSKKLTDALDTPVFLYNFPDLTGQDIGLDVITRLGQRGTEHRGHQGHNR
ncbi:dihydrodipicolinate synthase family protein [Salmonella enterica]|uniref:dihydrodipicolinate synthase family protein n=1 Tax=Salmonella enterica TaxID=28901 RepID=UPI0002EC2496|nr:dihydrodipicolinate synthase family protein [Salmonella enterica]